MWRERKRLWCGLPWTFTVYSYDAEKITVDTGFLNTKQDEIRLYRVQDLSVTRSLLQRIFGLGTIHISSKDRSMGNFEFKNIRNVMQVKDGLSAKVEAERDRKRVGVREYMADGDDDDDIV